MDFHQLAWRALHFSARSGLWSNVIQKENPTLFPISQHICCSNAIPSCARRAQGQQGTTASSLCRLQPALPSCVLGPHQEPAGLSSQPPSVQSARGLAWSSSWKAARQGWELAHGCCFSQSLGLCLATAAGWASSTVREWGWDKLFLRSPLLGSSSFLTSPRA